MKSIKHYLSCMIALLGTLLMCVSCDSGNKGLDLNNVDYGVIQINGKSYACYDNRSLITFGSDWDLSSHSGSLRLDCGELEAAQKGVYSSDYWYQISLRGQNDLKKGSKLEDFSPILTSEQDRGDFAFDYVSGSATVTDKKFDELCVKFDSFKFAHGSTSYAFSGTVRFAFREE